MYVCVCVCVCVFESVKTVNLKCFLYFKIHTADKRR
jgi:hypothetical protein